MMMICCIQVAAVLTGGFIFPLFMAGASLGRGLAQIRGIPFISDVPPVLLAMSIATGAAQTMSCCLTFSPAFPWSRDPPRLLGGQVMRTLSGLTSDSFGMLCSTQRSLLPR